MLVTLVTVRTLRSVRLSTRAHCLPITIPTNTSRGHGLRGQGLGLKDLGSWRLAADLWV